MTEEFAVTPGISAARAEHQASLPLPQVETQAVAEGPDEIRAAAAESAAGRRFRLLSLAPSAALVVALAVHQLLPTWQEDASFAYSGVLSVLLGLSVVLLAASTRAPRLRRVFESQAPLVTVVILILVVWDLLTAKSKTLPAPFFPTPDKIVDAYATDWPLLLKSALYSVRLLLIGYLIGTVIGFFTGVAIGWSPRWNYWVTPLMRLIGPIPATAWIPIALVVFPTSFLGSVFLLALASWFPVTIMTASGIANVPKSYFEVALSLGADKKYLIRHVAVPAAFPLVFVGLFVGLTMAMLTLIVAELLGVKAGLGWYISWAQGWAQFGKVYASLLVIAVLFSSIIAAMFKGRNRLLQWQKGLVRW